MKMSPGFSIEKQALMHGGQKILIDFLYLASLQGDIFLLHLLVSSQKEYLASVLKSTPLREGVNWLVKLHSLLCLLITTYTFFDFKYKFDLSLSKKQKK